MLFCLPRFINEGWSFTHVNDLLDQSDPFFVSMYG
jgi:hypothetical protein